MYYKITPKKYKIMKTYELVKSKIEELNREINSYNEIEAACPVMKRTRLNDELVWILQNPATKKWAVITEEQVEELNNLYMLKKNGVSPDEDPFILK